MLSVPMRLPWITLFVAELSEIPPSLFPSTLLSMDVLLVEIILHPENEGEANKRSVIIQKQDLDCTHCFHCLEASYPRAER